MSIHKNGWVVQDKNCPLLDMKNFIYNGINAYDTFPLIRQNDIECRRVSDEQFQKKISENSYQLLNFISDKLLLDKYISLCKQKNINCRVLFIESNYSEEICRTDDKNSILLGYEYCPIPFDEQIITDFDWCTQLTKFIKRLNENGLFDNYEDALAFKKRYDLLFKKGIVGDGEFLGYIMKVSEQKFFL